MIVEFNLNGTQKRMEVDPDQKLVHFLRDNLGLTGTKSGCDIGECGACSVIMNGKLVKSCLVPMKKADGKSIITIEGVCDENGEPNDLQKAFLVHGATQCGYCTPGMVLAGEVLLSQNPNPSRDQIRQAISENLCRCTGYQQIIDAIEATAKQRNLNQQAPIGEQNV
jgi:carbon-monoxide dehydrogenase small subunit